MVGRLNQTKSCPALCCGRSFANGVLKRSCNVCVNYRMPPIVSKSVFVKFCKLSLLCKYRSIVSSVLAMPTPIRQL
ncbi:hypothetical protein RMSM_05107 [Rhodopirellula maiorica SM1]|uniref:Uncharacterized protein n=1 Tax=Rhodopirellula maiorica SM1 TaxID=1265738 RepID=M5RF37_9BACT|nr:hypothetical protein RMSM_05107 [Rhodopirellula maiorica SM1]